MEERIDWALERIDWLGSDGSLPSISRRKQRRSPPPAPILSQKTTPSAIAAHRSPPRRRASALPLSGRRPNIRSSSLRRHPVPIDRRPRRLHTIPASPSASPPSALGPRTSPRSAAPYRRPRRISLIFWFCSLPPPCKSLSIRRHSVFIVESPSPRTSVVGASIIVRMMSSTILPPLPATSSRLRKSLSIRRHSVFVAKSNCVAAVTIFTFTFTDLSSQNM
uniref:Uncharacterized protein n=1 Tax=Oryza rufipogon TaxID=4529 RepID=A0A0E0NDZ8_ORYRU